MCWEHDSVVGCARTHALLQLSCLATVCASSRELQVFEVPGSEGGERHTVYVVAFTNVTFMDTLNCPVRFHTRAFGGA